MKKIIFTGACILLQSLTILAADNNKILTDAEVKVRANAQEKVNQVVRDAALGVQVILPLDLPDGAQDSSSKTSSFKDLKLTNISYYTRTAEKVCEALESSIRCKQWIKWMGDHSRLYDNTHFDNKSAFLTVQMMFENQDLVCRAKLPLGFGNQAYNVVLAEIPMPMQIECASKDQKEILLRTSPGLDADKGTWDSNWEVTLVDERNALHRLSVNEAFDNFFESLRGDENYLRPYAFISRRHVVGYMPEEYRYSPVFETNTRKLKGYRRTKVETL